MNERHKAARSARLTAQEVRKQSNPVQQAQYDAQQARLMAVDAEKKARAAERLAQQLQELPPVLLTMLKERLEVSASMVLKARARLKKYQENPMKTTDKLKLWQFESYTINDQLQDEMWTAEHIKVKALIAEEEARLALEVQLKVVG